MAVGNDVVSIRIPFEIPLSGGGSIPRVVFAFALVGEERLFEA